MDTLEVGYGTIRAGGREEWGYREGMRILTEDDSHQALQKAINLGITFFDFAPAYKRAEEWGGSFIRSLPLEVQSTLTIATKVGENYGENGPYTIWERDDKVALAKQSIDRSLALLGRIDILQIHKADLSVLKSQALEEVIAYAKSKGIKYFGASVSSVEAAQLACASETFSYLQFPFNLANQTFEGIISLARSRGITVLINRPLGMGELLYTLPGQSTEERLMSAMRFLRRHVPSGYVLFGTGNPDHLEEDYQAFRQAGQE